MDGKLDLLRQTNASKPGWETFCLEMSIRGKYPKNDKNVQKQYSGPMAAKFQVLTFTKGQPKIPHNLHMHGKTIHSLRLKIVVHSAESSST